ncbi:MAG: hypothetical protein K2L96_06380 [Muribaculaceae bacterium]|nr:hypothetical protein [Muribaculaceae bacterium]
MNKKITLLLALVLGAVFSVAAQSFSGRWSLFPTVGTSIDRVVCSDSKVFFTNSSRLSHYSEDDAETYHYANSDAVASVDVSSIHYNPDTRQLLVVYSDYNIDIIDADGSVHNMSAIRDAVLTTAKDIEDVAFYGDEAYIATNFGLVVVDMKSATVKQSGIYGFGPSLVGVTEKFVVLYFYSPIASAGIPKESFYVAPRNAKLSSFSAFKNVFSQGIMDIQELNGTNLVTLSSDGWRTRIVSIDPETLAMKADNRLTTVVSQLVRGADGRVYAVSSTDVKVIDPETTQVAETVQLPAGLNGRAFGFGKKGLADAWISNASGLGKYDLKTSTVLMSPYFPEGLSVKHPHYMEWDSQGRLWVTNISLSESKSIPSGKNAYYDEKYVALIDGNRLEDRTPTTGMTSFGIASGWYDFFEPSEEEKARYQEEMWRMQWSQMAKDNYAKTKQLCGVHNRLLPDLDDPDKFWVAGGSEGIVLCEKGEGYSADNVQGDALAIYSRINMPYLPTKDWSDTRVYNLDYDPEGNLWVFFWTYADGSIGPRNAIDILPAKIRKDRPARVKYADWVVYPEMPGYDVKYDIVSCFSHKSNMLFVLSSTYAGSLHAIDTKGTYLNPNDDVLTIHPTVIDQDGNVISPLVYTDIKEDKTGMIWVGTSSGLYVIPDPQSAASESMRVRRPVVPRNDGTNFGDYLLDGADISCIAVDPNNRKWIGTADAGVYLVSADGTKIISHFDKSNSPLVSDEVYSIAADPNSNRVYIGTRLGVMCYESDASPAKDDFSEVYVYPNPVRPEYTGWITVAGLMDNSLVKIADINGNIVFQGKSSGGSFIWDGCNAGGERVRTGVYLVLASAGDDSSSMAVVSKIMIMN